MSETEIGTRATFDALIGATVAKQFRLESVLGVGAMGVVFRATDLRAASEQSIALKVVLPDPKQQRTVPRLLRGARLAAQVKHPHVVETMGYGRLGSDRQGYYVAMELVDGVPLSRLLAVSLSPGAISSLMSQVLEALGYMHARGILHRDIKPDNVLVKRADDGRLYCKLSDFGIAAETWPDATHLTQPGMVIGTPMYMAPEQMAGKGLDKPTMDLYPVGVMLYELLSGQLPFAGHNMAALIAKISEDPPVLTARSGIDVPPALIDAVMRLLARQPEDRFLLAADAKVALAPFVEPATLSLSAWQGLCEAPRPVHARDLPPGWAKGDATQVFAVGTDSRSGTEARAVPTEMPLVGRESVLEMVHGWADEVEHDQGRAVLITGCAGIGKSAVMSEVVTQLAESGRFLVARQALAGTSSTRDCLRHVVDHLLGTTGRSALHVERAVIDFLRRAGEDDPDDVRDLVGFLRPEGAKQSDHCNNFALVQRFLRRISGVRPVLLALDDLNRGGPDAAAFLEFLLLQVSLEPFPILIMATLSDECRSQGFRAMLERSTRFEGTIRHTVHLEAVDEEVLASALTAHMGVSRSRARQIARRSAGNPLFALHLARGMATGQTANGRLDTETGEQVPQALQELLAVSIGRQLEGTRDPEGLRELLDAVAILGSAVDVSLLEAFLAADIAPARLDRDLDICLDLGLLTFIGTDGADVVGFSPAVMRDVMLAGLNPRRARRLHRRAIDVRTAWAGDRVDAEAGALGDHWEAVGQRDQAIAWWLRGQQFEMRGGDALLGVEWGRKVLANLDASDVRYGPCAIALGRTLLDAGDLAQAEEALRPVVAGPDAELAVRAADVLGDVYENSGNDQAWTDLVEQLSARAHELSPAGKRAFDVVNAFWLINHGRAAEAVRAAERALEGAEPGEQAQRAAQRLAFGYLFHNRLDDAEAMARRAVAESGERLDLRSRSMRALGVVHAYQGRTEQAAQCHRQVIDMCRRSGLMARIPVAMIDLGDTLFIQGNNDAAKAEIEAAERVARDLGLHASVRVIEFRLIGLELLSERTEGILERIRAVSKSVEGISASLGHKMYQLLEAWLFALEGRIDQALDAFDRMGDVQGLPHHPRFVIALEIIANHMVAAVSDPEQPLSSSEEAAVCSVIGQITKFVQKVPGSCEAGARCQDTWKRLQERL